MDAARGRPGDTRGGVRPRRPPVEWRRPGPSRSRKAVTRVRRALLAVLPALCGVLIPMTTARSDEGMWLLNEPPRALLKARYGFDLTGAWLERARLASVRFNNGGSGGFVSPEGLIVTNHHIGADA